MSFLQHVVCYQLWLAQIILHQFHKLHVDLNTVQGFWGNYILPDSITGN